MSWVEAELREQPAALERFLARRRQRAGDHARGFSATDVRYLLIVSRGSSSNVARYMQYLFGTVNRLPVAFATPSLYTVYDAPPRARPRRRDRHLAVGGFSGRGRRPRRGAQAGPADACDHERSGVSARARRGWIAAAACRRGARRRSDEDVPELDRSGGLALDGGRPLDGCDELLAMPGKRRGADRRVARRGRKALDRYRDVEGGSVVARGVNYGTAFEIALKIRELSGAQFEAFSSADLLHGPIAAAESRSAGDRDRTVGADAAEHAGRGRQGARARSRGDRDQRRRTSSSRAADTAFPLVAGRPGMAEPAPDRRPGPGRGGSSRDASQGVDVDSPVGLTKITLTR